MANAADIEDFLSGPLVSWLCSCLGYAEKFTDYEELVDGVLIHQVFLQIDPEPLHREITPSFGNAATRVRNLDVIMKNIKNLYEEELCQVVLVTPDCVALGNDPESKAGLENMNLLLLLLLGCAVQCPNKESFIDGIKEMNVDIQHSIVDCIKQVTDSQQIVLTQETSEPFSPELMIGHIRRLAKERDDYLQRWVTNQRGDGPDSQRKLSSQVVGGGNTHHLAVELADWKSRLRKQRQELEEKAESLAECREDLEHHKGLVGRLRQEVQELTQDARAAKAYRDELDAMRERAERVDKLEGEVQRYREKLSDIEFYKTRVEELREDNKVLLETREMLEEQLQQARKRGDHKLELESELLKYKQHLNELVLDREADHEKLQELFEENAQLQLVAKSAAGDQTGRGDVESDSGEGAGGAGGDDSLSEQLTSNAQARALKLELENRRLLSAIDNLKEASFHDSSNKILELEKDKKKISIKVEQLQENCQRLTQQNVELEQLFKDAMLENRKVHDSMTALKVNSDRLHADLTAARSRVEALESGVECGLKDKQRLQLMLESLQRRSDEQERAALQAEVWKVEALQVPEVKLQLNSANTRIEVLEKENQSAQRELTKLKETVEEKDKALDRCYAEATVQVEETDRLSRELDELGVQIVKLQEVERESQELMSRAAVDKETLTTLQSDLVAHKLNTEQYRRILEKLGLSLDDPLDPDTVLDRIASSPEVERVVGELTKRKGASPTAPESAPEDATPPAAQGSTADGLLLSENANLQVNVATLRSQITSLSSQHLALQLANSQLAAEKDELVKERGLQQTAHERLVLDQVTLQSLHEQLTSDYETLLAEAESLRTLQRDLRSELRGCRELCATQEAAQAVLEADQEKLRAESRSLANLRAEHSSLKDDFRNLFTASEKMKTEYRSLQEEYRTLRGENGGLKLRLTELQGEMASRGDRSTMLEVELSKLSNRCEMLSQMNSGLEDDRRSLMDHVSLLLGQYHELLTHSLEDKEHYHTEEKLFTDKLNNLCRQKEKLEEKIMEHYRKLESCSTKKKSFGATLVKRVRKAGSDLISKVPRNRRASWVEGSRPASGQATSHGSESGESDTSCDDLKTRDGFARSSLSLGSAGTRRTVYFTEEENDDAAIGEGGEEDTAPPVAGPTHTSTPRHDDKPFLVYNRISTVIGNTNGAANEASIGRTNGEVPDVPSQGVSQSKGQGDEAKKKGKGKGENSIWYEYGCV